MSRISLPGRGLRPKLLLFFSLALILPTIVIASIVYYSARSALLLSAFREERELSRRLADRFSDDIQQAQRSLSMLRTEPPLRSSSSRDHAKALRSFLLRSPDMLEIATYDTRGRGIARAVRTDGKVVWGDNPSTRAGRPEFISASAGKTYLGNPRMEGIPSSPQIVMSVPLGSPLRGVVIARFSLKNFLGLVIESDSPTARPYVVDGQGRLIVHPDKAGQIPGTDWSSRVPVRKFIDNRKGEQGTLIRFQHNGDVRLAVFHLIGTVGWAVIVETSTKTLLGPLRRLGHRVTALAALLGVIIWGIGFIFIHRLLKPLDVIQQGLERIGHGEFHHRIKLRGGDEELKKVADTVNRMASDLNAIETTKRDLSHMIVHDLKNPLSAVLGSIECVLMLNKNVLPPEGKKILSLGAKSGRELLRMIQNLLDMAKMEEGKLALHPEPFSMLELAGQCVDDLEPQIAKENKYISVEVSPRLPMAFADRDLIHRVMANLLANALKHTPSGTEISIHVRQGSASDQLVVSVRDTGTGISPDFINRVFEKFSQAEGRKTNERVGSGLGLPFCKLAVEAHGGRVWVESELGRGSEFFFTVPAGGPAPSELPLTPVGKNQDS